ncbi:DUF408-domain-containing protein [Hesseltinella vesiculosa]|uniref:RNA polymerase II subunit B1 CTD phosphatase RPAP2 homolog n=1 Tax=Hesseltinella vesiculosa TaxID=101127 RepID=A0A1X2GXK0_9FUNG|nr:DUF408-domain-containing protein [Hesseltinella vesiculosa]
MSTSKSPRANRRPKKKLTEKQKIVQTSAQRRQQVQDKVFGWQEQLFSDDAVSVDILQQAAPWLQPQTYDEVIQERHVQRLCGYPLCDRPPAEQQRFHISLARRKVYDQSELRMFCSSDCLQKSKYFAMQLSDDPVWTRDQVSLSNTSSFHVIPMDLPFPDAVKQHKQSTKSHQDIRNDYVQQRIAAVPLQQTLPAAPSSHPLASLLNGLHIVEKESSATPSDSPAEGAHDAIEGYRIDHRNKRTTSTILLASKPPAPSQKEHLPVPDDVDDEQALLDDAMETMMMLKRQMDQPDPSPPPPASSSAALEPPKPDADAPMPPSSSVRFEEKPLTHPSLSASSSASTNLSTPSIASTPSGTSSANPPQDNVIHVTSKPAPATKKKKKNEPEMSLFGKIWTMLDRITTSATRRFLANQPLPSTSEEATDPALAEENALRSQIFSEKILEMYNAMIRAQLGIEIEIEKDMIRLMRTFRFADANMVVLDATQTYMMTLILVKTVALELFDSSKMNDAFEQCCQQIGQSTDMIDACIRVLRIAST